MKARFPGIAIVLAAAAALPVSAKDKWVQVRSPHFEVISNGSGNDARQVAAGFEQMRMIFAAVSKLRVDSGAQTIVVAPRDERTMKALVPMYWRRRGQMHPAGLFRRGWERDYAIIRLDQEGHDYNTVYHEYIHKLLHLNFPRIPVWLDEGLAEFYGTAHVSKNEAILGMPSLRIGLLRERPPYPLDKVLSADHSSPYITREDQAPMFYAESWGLTHYLILGKGMGNGERLKAYFRKLQHGDDPLPAFEQVFGNLKQVEEQFEEYVRQMGVAGLIWKHSTDVGERNFTVRELSPAEADAELGGFYLYSGEQDTAKGLLEQALSEQPNLDSAHENMAFLHFVRGEDPQALEEFNRALQLDPNDYLALYYRAMMMNFHPGSDFSDPGALETVLQQVLKLNPDFAPALVVESQLYLQEHRNGEALHAALLAQHLEPNRAGYDRNVARILLLLRDRAQAGTIAAFVARGWWASDRAEALDLLAQTETPGSNPPDVPSLDYAQGTQAVAGTIESLTCPQPGDAAHDLQLVLLTPGGPRSFHDKTFPAGFSDTVWYGEDHFTLCHHLIGFRAVVRYKPADDPHLPAAIGALEIRDDLRLPQPATNVAAGSSTK